MDGGDGRGWRRPELAPRLVARLADIFPASEHVRDVALAEGERAHVAPRLGELEREGLVTAEGPGRWSVPADFLQRLESRRRPHRFIDDFPAEALAGDDDVKS